MLDTVNVHTYVSIRMLRPSYLTNIMGHINCGHPRCSLPLSSLTDFSLPWLVTKFSECAFAYAGPSARSTLLEDLDADTDPELFRKQLKQLKTHFSVWHFMSVDDASDYVMILCPVIVTDAR